MRKTKEELQKINTKNLLRYYKAERRRFYGSGYICSCCGEYYADIYPERVEENKAYYEHEAYLKLIKTELATREHIVKK